MKRLFVLLLLSLALAGCAGVDYGKTELPPTPSQWKISSNVLSPVNPAWSVNLPGGANVSGQVATYAALRAYSTTNLSSGDIMYVRSRATAGDGGDGHFRYISGAAGGTYTDDGGVTLLPTGGDGSAAWVRVYSGPVNVKWYGTNSAAFQAAIDYAATVSDTTSVSTVDIVTAAVFVPNGTYATTTAIRLKNGVVLTGESRSAMISHSGATDAFDTDTTTYKHNIGIKSLSIIGDGTDSRYGISGWGLIRSCFIEDVLIDGFQDSIHLVNSWTIQLLHNQGQNARRYNIYGDGLTHAMILGGRYDTATSHGIYVENSTTNTESLKIIGVAVQAGQAGGIVFNNIKNAIVDGCFLEALCQDLAGTHAYLHADMDTTGNIEITNNYINKGASGDDGRAAVFINDVKNLLYSGNTTQSQAVGLEIGSGVEAGVVIESTFGNTTRYSNASAGPVIIKEGAKAPLFLGPDMNDGGFSYDKASGVFGDWNAGAPRYVALGLWSSIPAIQAGGTGTDYKLEINPNAGNVEIAYNTGGEVWTGQTVVGTTLTGSNVTVDNTKGFFGVDCTGGARAATLSATHTAGREIVIAKTDAGGNALTITPSSGLVDGGATLVLSAAYEVARLISDGTNWLRE